LPEISDIFRPSSAKNEEAMAIMGPEDSSVMDCSIIIIYTSLFIRKTDSTKKRKRKR